MKMRTMRTKTMKKKNSSERETSMMSRTKFFVAIHQTGIDRNSFRFSLRTIQTVENMDEYHHVLRKLFKIG